MIDEVKRRGLPYAYLGYYVEGSPSMSYKTRFVPNRLRGPNGMYAQLSKVSRLAATPRGERQVRLRPPLSRITAKRLRSDAPHRSE